MAHLQQTMSTMSWTLTHATPHHISSETQYVEFMLPGFHPSKKWKPQKATCTQFAWDQAGGFNRQHEYEVKITMAPKPFAKGSMRVAYEMLQVCEDPNVILWYESRHDASGPLGFTGSCVLVDITPGRKAPQALRMVAKIGPQAPLQFVRSSCLASFYADAFCRQSRQKVTVLPCYLYSVTEDDGDIREYCVEDYVPGAFVKWISNSGCISDEQGSDVIAAFAHFSWHCSNGSHMVSDIQGVIHDGQYVLFDPQICSGSRNFGRADLGMDSMRTFFSNHKCNKLCQALGLSTRRLPVSQKESKVIQEPPTSPNECPGERVLVVKFGSPPIGGDGLSEFFARLSKEPQLMACQQTLKDSGHSCELRGGVMLFVTPEQAARIPRAVAKLPLLCIVVIS